MDYLNRLYNSEIDIAEEIRLSNHKREIEKKLHEVMEQFKATLPPDKAEDFEKLLDLQADIQDEYHRQYFFSGYRLAIGLIADGFSQN